MTFAISVQKRAWVSGRNVRPRCFDVCSIGTSTKMRIEASRARTPPSLLGIERRIAYANKKYHSGLMWAGVTRGFAGVKLSGSPRRLGANSARLVRAVSSTAKPTRSL